MGADPPSATSVGTAARLAERRWARALTCSARARLLSTARVRFHVLENGTMGSHVERCAKVEGPWGGRLAPGLSIGLSDLRVGIFVGYETITCFPSIPSLLLCSIWFSFNPQSSITMTETKQPIHQRETSDHLKSTGQITPKPSMLIRAGERPTNGDHGQPAARVQTPTPN